LRVHLGGFQNLFPIVSKLQRILPSPLLHLAVDSAVRHLLTFTNTNISHT
jgi:hypothetical protein